MEAIKKSLKVLTILVGLLLFLSVLNFASNMIISSKLSGTGSDSGSGPVVVPDTKPQQVPSGSKVKGDFADDDAVKGSDKAEVTIVEFSDFECPFCGRYSTQTYPQIIKNYVDTGDVKYIFRDFPLGFHANAQKAAEAAECAGDQDKYWEYHDLLFLDQKALDVTTLKKYATDLGLDTDDFNTCLDSGTHEAEVKKDLADGGKVGVGGTPSFLIGNDKDGYQLIVGACPYSSFESALNAELDGKDWAPGDNCAIIV
ncbi:DsbA family protein [Nanoarchaeota archaeon]